MSAIRVEKLPAAPDGGRDVVGLCGTRGRSSGVDPVRRLETSWERYFGEVCARLEEVHAMLALAEDQLARDQRAGPIQLTPATLIDASVDAAATVDSKLAPSERPVGQQPAAVLRLVREEWRVAVRKSKALEDRASEEVRPVLKVLGRERGVVQLGAHSILLTRRHTEILVLLVRHPPGLTTEQIALALYGDPGRPGAIRTAVCRLRKVLGPWICSQRGQVKLDAEADFLVVERLLRAGRVREAALHYSATLLPRSEAPGVVETREALDAWVRSAVMTCDDRDALWAWLGSASGCDDALAWKRFLADVDFADPRRPLAVSRLAQLRNALSNSCLTRPSLIERHEQRVRNDGHGGARRAGSPTRGVPDSAVPALTIAVASATP